MTWARRARHGSCPAPIAIEHSSARSPQCRSPGQQSNKRTQFGLEWYRHTSGFPSEERFGLTRQLRNSAASVPTNIAEGCGREGERELARFLSIAAGSASEAEYQLLLARDLGYLDQEPHEQLDALANELEPMLNSFIQRLS